MRIRFARELPSTIGVVALLVSACRAAPEPAQAATPAPDSSEVRIDPNSAKLASISSVPATLRQERVIASLPAEVALDEDHTVRVFTPVAGRIRTVDVSQGSTVAAGAALAHIASPDLAQAVSDAEKATAAATQAEASLARTRDLLDHRIAARKDVEQAETDARQARSELARAQARLAALGASGSRVGADYVLRAPIGGIVVDRSANPGAEVRPDAAASLFTITSLDVVWIRISVQQRELATIHPGVRLRFVTDALPGREFEATVTLVSGALDPQTRTALVRAALPNPGHLLRALETGTARLFATTPTPVLVVPTRALVTQGATTVVYVERAPGRYVRRTVTVGEDDGTTAVILSGVTPGERVVVDGSLMLGNEGPRGE